VSTSTTYRRTVRIGTIVWGAILVGVAVLALILILGGPLSSAAILWGVVGFGVLLVLAAVATGIVRAAKRRPAADTQLTADHPPIG
jgi:predicted lysophospholipase L1 biosynthesis ABC-type transport system permease subunit